MGGWGSGRGQGGRDTTSDCRSLDVRRWQHDGHLKPWQAFSWTWSRDGETVASIQISTEADRLVLNYRCKIPGGDWEPRDYPVLLDWTNCNYGGRRAWFLCPTRGCGRRVALLYLGDTGIFACRQCTRLAYACQRESDIDRSARRADKIRHRLGWEAGILNGNGNKPKGMHWRTFARMTSAHNAFSAASFAGMAHRFGMIGRGLNGVEELLKSDD